MAKSSKSEAEAKPIVEAILFATDRPLAAAKIARAVEGTDARIVKKCIDLLNKEYEESGRSFQIEEIAGGFQILTKPEFWKWISKIRPTRADGRLSPASLETLAIVAYKQPVLRADIEAVRGVQSGELLRTLLERGLVKVVGRLDTIGRPILYGTTRRFLELMGVKAIKDLPRMDQLRLQNREKEAEAAPPQAPPPTDATAPEEPSSPESQEKPVPSEEPSETNENPASENP